MLTLFLRWFKGLIIGWLMSLVFFLVRRALTKAFGQMNVPQQGTSHQTRHQPHPTAEQPPRAPQGDIIETIWVGMSTEQLRQSFGEPTTIKRNGQIEIWSYPRLDGQQGHTTEVTLENSVITKWQDVEDTLPQIENSAR